MQEQKPSARNFALLISLSAMLVALIVFGGTSSGMAKAAAKPKTGSVTMSMAHFSPYPPMLIPMRIGIAVHSSQVRFAVWQPGAVFVNGTPVFDLHPQHVYTVSGGSINELGTGRRYPMPMDYRTHISAPDYRVWANNRWYRGCLELINYGHKTTAINLLDLEAYLLGVVPSEMPARWNLEALKAQAVAARSYAWAHQGSSSKWRSEGFDLVPDVRDQAYKGLAAEMPSTNLAVQHTQGIVLKDSGKIKAGFYRAWVGDDAEQNLNIRKKVINGDLLQKVTGVPSIVGVTVKQWDEHGRAHSITIMGQKKSRDVSGVALAQILGLATAGILDVREDGSNWVFTYRGPGNGARGLSQNGANMLASRGWKFDQILHQYYQDADGSMGLDLLDAYKQVIAAQQRFQQMQLAKQKKSKDE